MYIYHYSSEPRFSIKTKRASGAAVPEEIAKSEANAKRHSFIGAYVDHISFFCDPIPSTKLPAIYGEDHQAWRNGNVLYEHLVDVSTLEKNIAFTLVESHREWDEFHRFAKKNGWTGDDPELLAKWYKHIKDKRKTWGEEGKDLKLLEKQVRAHSGRLLNDFVDASMREDFEEGRMKYAANVPHLMLYPKDGVIVPEKISKVVMGSAARIPIYGF